MPGGDGALGDDGEGCLDAYFANGAALPSLGKSPLEHAYRLYRDDYKGRFKDVTEVAGVSGVGQAAPVAAADVDNDSDQGLCLARVNCNILHSNEGDGHFEDVPRPSGIFHVGKGVGVGFAGFDGNGFPDTQVAIDSVRGFLLVNRGDRSFIEQGLEYGVALRKHGAAIAGMGAHVRDFDDDGRSDILASAMINERGLYCARVSPGKEDAMS